MDTQVQGGIRERIDAGARLGDLLKSARLRLGLTIRDLAETESIGVSAAFLSRVERNESLPSDELLVKLARRLGVDVSAALLQLFRERASPEVRPYLPGPERVGTRSANVGAAVDGAEALADPLSQIVETHRSVVKESQRLRGEVTRLSEDVQRLAAENVLSNRGFLPDVNRFLGSLFNYESDLVRRDAVVSRNGDATITVTLEGIVPKQGGKPLRNLQHSAFIPCAVDGSLSIAGNPTRFEILEKPADLVVENTFKRESPERGSFLVSFPEGFRWSGPNARLSYRFSYRLEKAYVMTMEEARAQYGRRSVHDAPLEWSSCFINKPVKRLEISVTYPEGYSPGYVDKWVWWTETSFLECDYNLADRLLLDEADGIEMDQGERTVVRLRATNPLLGFSYGIVWQPLAKRQFLALIRG